MLILVILVITWRIMTLISLVSNETTVYFVKNLLDIANIIVIVMSGFNILQYK